MSGLKTAVLRYYAEGSLNNFKIRIVSLQCLAEKVNFSLQKKSSCEHYLCHEQSIEPVQKKANGSSDHQYPPFNTRFITF